MCVSPPCCVTASDALKNTAEPQVALLLVSAISNVIDEDDEDAVQAGVSSRKSPPPCCPALLLVSRTVSWNMSCATLSRKRPPPEIEATLLMTSHDVTVSRDFFPVYMAPPAGAEFADSTEPCTSTRLDEPRKHPPLELLASLDQMSLSLTTRALVCSYRKDCLSRSECERTSQRCPA